MTMIRSPLPARLSAFLAVGEALNFRKAAERLGIAQPAHGEFERLVPGRLAERFAPVDAQ